MKKLSMFLILLMTISALAVPSGVPVVDLHDMELLKKKMTGKTGVVIHVPAETELALQLDLKGDIVKGETEPVKLVFGRSFFVFFSADPEETPQFSWNQSDWREWEDMFGGSLSLGFENLAQPLKLDLELHSK